MKCFVSDCANQSKAGRNGMCEKHYMRMYRHGSTKSKRELKKDALGYTREYRITMPGKGYQRLYEPAHPLADRQGYVAEHRMVAYAKYGAVLPPCELCGVVVKWDDVHIDHIDEDVKNNNPGNVRPLCFQCNVRRTKVTYSSKPSCHAVTVGEKTLTPTEWAREPGVLVTGKTIVARIARGYTPAQAVFGAKKTHNGNHSPAFNRKHQGS